MLYDSSSATLRCMLPRSDGGEAIGSSSMLAENFGLVKHFLPVISPGQNYGFSRYLKPWPSFALANRMSAQSALQLAKSALPATHSAGTQHGI